MELLPLKTPKTWLRSSRQRKATTQQVGERGHHPPKTKPPPVRRELKTGGSPWGAKSLNPTSHTGIWEPSKGLWKLTELLPTSPTGLKGQRNSPHRAPMAGLACCRQGPGVDVDERRGPPLWESSLAWCCGLASARGAGIWLDTHIGDSWGAPQLRKREAGRRHHEAGSTLPQPWRHLPSLFPPSHCPLCPGPAPSAFTCDISARAVAQGDTAWQAAPTGTGWTLHGDPPTPF